MGLSPTRLLFICVLVVGVLYVQTQGAVVRAEGEEEGENEVVKPEVITPLRPLPSAVPAAALEAFYYDRYSDITNQDTQFVGRPGNVSRESTCEDVRDVPAVLRDHRYMRPRGISAHYRKFTEAYGIPVVGSSSVPDEALSRACYVLRFLLAGRRDLREAYYRAYGRVAVIAADEDLGDLPEYNFLPEIMLSSVRGLGAIPLAPASSAGEENILCYGSSVDENAREDMMVREIAEGIFHLAAKKVIPGIQDELTDIYNNAISTNKWSDTYAQYTPASYFGKGVQCYLNVNGYANPPNGIHNHVNNRVKLRSYDPSLFHFIQNLFPCTNRYLKRCRSRGNEHYQDLDMDCFYPRMAHFSRSERGKRLYSSLASLFNY